MNLASLQSLFFTKKIMDSYTAAKPSTLQTKIMLPKSIQIYDSDTDDDDKFEKPICQRPDVVFFEKPICQRPDVVFFEKVEKIPQLQCPLVQPVLKVERLIVPQKKINKRDRPTVPRKKDHLFWCFYIIVNGFSEYEYPGNNSFENEKREKFRLIEFLRKENNKAILKKYKIIKVKEDIENDLANKERIGMKTFIALCYTHQLNILFIHRRKCFQIHGGHPEEIYHVVHQYDPPHQNSHGLYKYAYDSDATIEEKTKYRDPTIFYLWETIDKPLKAVSSYKVADLTQICRINHVDSKGKTKPEMYEMLMDRM